MIKRRPKRPKIERGAGENRRLGLLRDRFQRERPSLDTLVSSGDYTAPVPQAELFMMLELAAALKQTRKEKRLSLSQVAKRSGIDKAALSRIESGQNLNPTIGTLETIARALGTRLRFEIGQEN